MLTFPKILPVWMYRNPEDIADDLIHRNECEKRKEERRKIVERNNKRKRIEALTRKAMHHA
jgi:hypothetical protein